MDLELLKSLLAVAETGSFSRAGTKLCVSQSAVSKRIKLLEELLGHPLLDRSGPILQLTEAGQIVERNARATLEIHLKCLSELAALKQQKKIEFRCTPSYGVSCLPLVTKALMEHRPDITSYAVSLGSLESISKSLSDGSCQLAVVEHCELMPVDKGHLLHTLNKDLLVLVAAPALEFDTTKLSIECLFKHTLYIRSSGCCSRLLLETKLKQHGYSLENFSKVLVSNDLNVILSALRSGLGVGYLAQDVVKAELASGSLVRLQLTDFDQHIQRSLLAGAGYVATEESNDLIQIIRSIAAEPVENCGCNDCSCIDCAM